MKPVSVVVGNVQNNSVVAMQLNLRKIKTSKYMHSVLFPTDGRVRL